MGAHLSVLVVPLAALLGLAWQLRARRRRHQRGRPHRRPDRDVIGGTRGPPDPDLPGRRRDRHPRVPARQPRGHRRAARQRPICHHGSSRLLMTWPASPSTPAWPQQSQARSGGIDVGEMRPRPDDLGPASLVLQSPEPGGASLTPYSSSATVTKKQLPTGLHASADTARPV